MSEKTEKATPKKRRDARREGDVFKSAELVHTLSLAAVLLALRSLTGSAGRTLLNYMKTALIVVNPDALPSATTFFKVFIEAALPFAGVALLAGIAGNVAQTGLLFMPKTAAPKFSRVNPVEGFRRIFSRRTLFAGAKAALKLALVAWIGYALFRSACSESVGLMLRSPSEGLRVLADLITGTGLRLTLALAAVGAADYYFERLEYEKRLRMSKQEIKDELRKTEGDPLIKSIIRSRQTRMARMRMMQDVPRADAVIVNPTHYAVAIRYEMGRSSAPTVVAKGVDRIALKIRQIAAENRVHITENPELARALYKRVDIGETIPAEYYRAVAEILAYVFRMRNYAARQAGQEDHT
jgi:flagellar biosynthetic protein FlhB